MTSSNRISIRSRRFSKSSRRGAKLGFNLAAFSVDPRAPASRPLHAPSVLASHFVEGVGDLAEGARADGFEQLGEEVSSGARDLLEAGEGVGRGTLPRRKRRARWSVIGGRTPACPVSCLY